MGLAASQARFLNLTARKTNLEYEGQQINQQRTSLANKSANYYSQMLTLTVPVPPSEANFTKVVYTYSVGTKTYTINQVSGTDRNASIIRTSSYVDSYNMSKTNQPTRFTEENGKIKFGSKEVKSLGEEFRDNASLLATIPDIADGLKRSIGSTEFNSKVTDPKLDIFVLNVGTEANPQYEYYFKSDLATAISADGNAYGYKQNPVTKYEQDAVTGAQITRDATGRIVAVSYDNNGTRLENLLVTASTIKDDVAYNDAYAEYQYQTFLYQQQMEEINAQTSVIQAQDKKLELRLKQLDTEQNAVSTEMENLSSLIDKNVDSSFKVFA